MTTIEELKAEPTGVDSAKLETAKQCAICKTPLGTMNDEDGEKWLRMHYERDHPGLPIRTELVK